MLRFLTKWILRGALFAGVASAAHSCGTAHLYGDDDAFASTPSEQRANQPQGRPQ